MTSTLPEGMRERVNALRTVRLGEEGRRYALNEILSQTDYDRLFAMLEETDRKAREDFAMKVFTAKTEGLFDGGDLFIKRKPIEQVVINELGYETYKAIQEAADALQSPSEERKT